MKTLAFISFLLFLSSCKVENNDDTNYQCKIIDIEANLTRVELIKSFDQLILESIATSDIPNSSGALGRNRDGYFHVRFQMGIQALADYAVFSESTLPLEYAVTAIEYAFEHQLPAGDFELVIPPDFTDQTPGEADLASGTSFFLSSLGISLVTLEQSDWYLSSELESYKTRIENLRPQIEAAANWLLSKRTLLENADENAPNRLFFNALAYYSLGVWLNNNELKNVGIGFAESAITMKHPKGYFLELNGWDSSYQGVAIFEGFNLFSILDSSEDLRLSLWDCLSCATDWQSSRVLQSGEISLKDNTRVYPGGEEFLGNEKGVDWIKTMMGFFYLSYYSKNNEFYNLAQRVKVYYHHD